MKKKIAENKISAPHGRKRKFSLEILDETTLPSFRADLTGKSLRRQQIKTTLLSKLAEEKGLPLDTVYVSQKTKNEAIGEIIS